MQISIETEREIKDEKYWDWAMATIRAMNLCCIVEGCHPRFTKANFQTLLETGEWSFEDANDYTKAKTTYRIKK